jgi:uncharacterized membrane protein
MSDAEPESHLRQRMSEHETPPDQGAFPVPDALETQTKKRIEDIVLSELELPQQRKREIAARITEEIHEVLVVATQESHSGPIPSSREMRGYEIASPGLADRVMKMAEIEQSARLAWYDKVLNRQFVLALLGQVFAFIFGCGLLYMAYSLGMAGHDWLAGAALTGGALGLASSFLKSMTSLSASSEPIEKPTPAANKPPSGQRKGSNRKVRQLPRK